MTFGFCSFYKFISKVKFIQVRNCLCFSQSRFLVWAATQRLIRQKVSAMFQSHHLVRLNFHEYDNSNATSGNFWPQYGRLYSLFKEQSIETIAIWKHLRCLWGLPQLRNSKAFLILFLLYTGTLRSVGLLGF